MFPEKWYFKKSSFWHFNLSPFCLVCQLCICTFFSKLFDSYLLIFSEFEQLKKKRNFLLIQNIFFSQLASWKEIITNSWWIKNISNLIDGLNELVCSFQSRAKKLFFKWPRLETPQLFCNTWQRGSCGQTKTEAEHNHDYGRRNPSYHEIFFGVDKVISYSHNCASASPQFHSKLLCSLNKLQSWLFQWSHQPQLQILSSPLITLWSLFTVARFPSTTYCIAHYIILFEFLARTSYICTCTSQSEINWFYFNGF